MAAGLKDRHSLAVDLHRGRLARQTFELKFREDLAGRPRTLGSLYPRQREQGGSTVFFILFSSSATQHGCRGYLNNSRLRRPRRGSAGDHSSRGVCRRLQNLSASWRLSGGACYTSDPYRAENDRMFTHRAYRHGRRRSLRKNEGIGMINGAEGAETAAEVTGAAEPG